MNSARDLEELEPMHREADEEIWQLSCIDDALFTIDAATRDALNEWLTRRGAPVFHICADEFELNWLDSAAAHWHVAAEVGAGMHRAVVALDSFAALDPLLVGEPFTLMPAPLRDLAVHRLVARALTRVPALANALELRALHWNVEQLPDWPCRLPFVLRRRSEGTQSTGCLLFENWLGLKWLHGLLPIDAQSTRARLSLRVPLRLSLGHSSIAAHSLQDLRPGDVVWIESGSIARDGIAVELHASAGRCLWRGRAQRHSLRIVTAEDLRIDTATSSTLQPEYSSALHASTGAQPMDSQRWQLDVPVTFDLGELHLKIVDLERLQPGHIVELQQDVATATVALRLAGRRIAEGTLIAVGKRLGVRIGTITAPHESDENHPDAARPDAARREAAQPNGPC